MKYCPLILVRTADYTVARIVIVRFIEDIKHLVDTGQYVGCVLMWGCACGDFCMHAHVTPLYQLWFFNFVLPVTTKHIGHSRFPKLESQPNMFNHKIE